MNPICECNEYSGCAIQGVLDLYHCLDVFVCASAPHFYSAESSIRETLSGMNPRRELHETGVHFDLVCVALHLKHFHINNTCLETIFMSFSANWCSNLGS